MAARSVFGEPAKLVGSLLEAAPGWVYSFDKIKDLDPVTKILESSPEIQLAVVRELFNRVAWLRDELGDPVDGRYWNLHSVDGFPGSGIQLLTRLLRRKLPLSESDLIDLVDSTAYLRLIPVNVLPHVPLLVGIAEKHIEKHGLSKGLKAALAGLEKTLNWCSNAPVQKLRSKVIALQGGPRTILLEPGEAWTDAVLADLNSMSAEEKDPWLALLDLCSAKYGGSPPASWRTRSKEIVSKIGPKAFKKRILGWFPLVDKPRTAQASLPAWQPNPEQVITETNGDILKGLVWNCTQSGDREVARALGTLAASAYRKLPGVGPRAPKIGNACVSALGEMPGMEGAAELAVLKVKIKFGTAQKLVEKAVTATAARVGMTREDIEELGVPDYGFSSIGRIIRPAGDLTAELVITGPSDIEVRCLKKDGTLLRTVPPAAKKSVTALKAVAKDMGRMLPAQRERIDRLHLAKKSWPVDVWRERYLDHPLIGVLGRRLIWRFRNGDTVTDALFHDDRLLTIDGKHLADLRNDATVELWHPIGEKAATVVAWRRLLEKLEIRQPFKQAHREIYVLTDAERKTDTYSNRFAAHVVKQHQFNALCAARGWKNVLKLLVDQEFPPPSITIPAWGLRAEFWTDGAGDNYGSDTNDTGTFLRLTTDQVRFYRIDAPRTLGHADGSGQRQNAQAIPVSEVPPLVFSEVMRDIDLFVGVSSVGNDPTWADGGPQGRYRAYWAEYSFGELSATAATRKEVLQGIVPRLEIASRCSFADRFLVVKGDLRTYKIHLGSGNILMAPNDQYLCIVPSRGAASDAGEKVFLPFEGDTQLSVILSKALLLADDTHITDETILRQIHGK